jgi:hypothetical protein
MSQYRELFNINFNVNLKLFLRLSNCALFGEKTLILIKMHGLYVKINSYVKCRLIVTRLQAGRSGV